MAKLLRKRSRCYESLGRECLQNADGRDGCLPLIRYYDSLSNRSSIPGLGHPPSCSLLVAKFLIGT